MATTLSLVAIFMPVGFMSGMVGRFLQSFGLTMAFAVLVSLLVSFTLTPMMCVAVAEDEAARARATRDHAHDSKHSVALRPARPGLCAGCSEWAMDHRWVVATVAVLVLLSSVPLFRFVAGELHAAGRHVGVRGDAARARRAASLDATGVMANRVATAIRTLPEVSYTMVTVAGDGATTRNGAIDLREAEGPGRPRAQRLPAWSSRCAAR